MSNAFDMKLLERNLTRKLRANYDQKKCAGAILRVTQGDQVCYERAEGYADIEKRTPIDARTIFRIYSMSKPITMTALMQLYEQGLVYPEDELRAFFPPVADMPVAVEQPDGSVRYEKQRSPITVKQLYTMTSGISYPGDDDAGAKSMAAAFDKHEGRFLSLEDMVNAMAGECALSFHPGEKWKYGFSHDIVGALIEKVSGRPFGEYLRENVFEPLGMADTAFWVSQDKQARFATAYAVENGEYRSLAGEKDFTADYFDKPGFESGGGGLVSTMEDYARLCQMLLGGGEYRGARLLGRKTVEMMSSNQLSDEQMKTFGWRERGYGYGVGMRVNLKPWVLNGSVGEFGWDGMMGTWMLIDPAEGLTVVYLQNMFPYNTNGMRLTPIVYGALV